MLKRILKVLFIGFIVFVFVISSYELFFHKAEAAWLTCDWNFPCSENNQSCSDTVPCHCVRLSAYQYACSAGGEPVQ